MAAPLTTMTDSEYDAYVRDERDERELTWLADGIPTLFQTIDPLTAAATDARIRAMGLKSWSDLLSEFGEV
jgi:hypothetical protein